MNGCDWWRAPNLGGQCTSGKLDSYTDALFAGQQRAQIKIVEEAPRGHNPNL